MADDAKLASTVATAILGIDTLWGGDVMNPSGTGRYIADSWYSDEPLPVAYTHPAAAQAARDAAACGAKAPDPRPSTPTSRRVDVPGAIDELTARPRARAACAARS